MKKKLYQNPEMEVVELKNNQALLAGSCATHTDTVPGCLGDGCAEEGD